MIARWRLQLLAHMGVGQQLRAQRAIEDKDREQRKALRAMSNR